MVIIFDKDLTTQRTLIVDNIQEQVMENRITGSYEREMVEGFQAQDLSNFTNRSFTTLNVYDNEGNALPIQKTYNYIDMVQVSYMDAINVYSVIISILNSSPKISHVFLLQLEISPLRTSKCEYYKEYFNGAPLIPITKPYFNGWAGSLEIGVIKNDKVVPIGYLSGLSDEIKANYKDYKGKVIEVGAMEVLETGGLRHAKMLNFRPDLTIKECTWEKIWGNENKQP